MALYLSFNFFVVSDIVMRLDYQSFKAGLSVSSGFLAFYKVAANFHIRSYLCKSFFIQNLNFYSLGIIFEGRILGKITFLSEYPHADKRRLEKKTYFTHCSMRTWHILFKVYLLNNTSKQNLYWCQIIFWNQRHKAFENIYIYIITEETKEKKTSSRFWHKIRTRRKTIEKLIKTKTPENR
jgi:hypothetical protein